MIWMDLFNIFATHNNMWKNVSTNMRDETIWRIEKIRISNFTKPHFSPPYSIDLSRFNIVIQMCCVLMVVLSSLSSTINYIEKF